MHKNDFSIIVLISIAYLTQDKQTQKREQENKDTLPTTQPTWSIFANGLARIPNGPLQSLMSALIVLLLYWWLPLFSNER